MFVLTACLIVCFKARAVHDILFSSFFAEKNVSSLAITCFYQDIKGHMWIGTQDGLNCFNGKTVKVFKHDRLNKSSLPDNYIVSICGDQAGNLWIGTSLGVSKLNPEWMQFENYRVDNHGDGLGFKMNVYVDKEQVIWATSGNTLYRFNSSKHAFEKRIFKIKKGFPMQPPPRLYNGIFEDSQKRYWVSCDKNLYRYDPEEEVFEPFTNLKKPMFFFPVTEDAQGRLFCGTWNDGLLQLNTVERSFDMIEHTGLHSCYAFQNLHEEPLLWYGNVFSSYQLQTKQIKTYGKDPSNPYAPKNDAVSALFLDAQNQLWIGYAGKGIQIVSPSSQIFRTIHLSETPNQFPSVNCFIKTKRYAYAGGWYNYSLARLDENYRIVKTWKSLIPKLCPDENNISDAWEDPSGTIWFTSSLGLIRLNEASGETRLFKMDSTLSKRNHFLEIASEGDSVLWLSGYFCGLTRFSIRSETFQNWGAHENALFWGITRDEQGILWLANNSGVLTGFNPVSHTFIEKRYDQLTEGAMYNSILYDSIRHVLWIATNNGLLKVNRNTFAAELFTEKNNLPTSQINTLQFDDHHRLWIATNKGLCLYDPEQSIFKTFFSNNGLPDNTLNQLFQMQPNGELIIGCKDGFSVLQTRAVSVESSSQRVLIDKIYESGKIIQPVFVNGKKEVEFRYDQNDLRIEFSSNDLINSEDNQLLYRLESFDHKWYTAHNGIVNYSKLAPGKYLFHVSGINHAGIKLKQDDYLVIIIHPPFWKTTWFIVFISAALFLLTLLAARYVFTRNLREKILILEKEQAIEKERSRISQDMHDELGSGLTKISIMSEVAMAQLTQPSKAMAQLQSISSSSRELVDNLQDIIWILNSKNDSLENLCAYLQEYALNYFEPFNIAVHIEFPDTIPGVKLSEDQRRNILLVFKESFHNISKHSLCKLVDLRLFIQNEQVFFVIRDDGVGFDPLVTRSFGNGLSGMKKRMASIHGNFSIHSSPQQGTVSEFNFRM